MLGVPPNVVPLIHLSTAEWTRVLNVNLYGVFFCCREVGALMAQQESGKIINIASLNAVSPAALSVSYNVAKAGVVSLTQTLAVELAPFGVNVNAISPGPVATEFHDTVMPQRAATLGITREAMVERVRASIPLGRWGKPEDIAKAVLFLASDQSEWMTGQNLMVAGGLAGVAAAPPKQLVRDWPAQRNSIDVDLRFTATGSDPPMAHILAGDASREGSIRTALPCGGEGEWHRERRMSLRQEKAKG